jgi:hypothetical protein
MACMYGCISNVLNVCMHVYMYACLQGNRMLVCVCPRDCRLKCAIIPAYIMIQVVFGHICTYTHTCIHNDTPPLQSRNKEIHVETKSGIAKHTTRTHTYTYRHSRYVTHILSLSLSLSHPFSYTHTYTLFHHLFLTDILSLTLSLIHIHTHSFTISFSHTYFLSRPFSYTYTLSLSLSHTHTHT